MSVRDSFAAVAQSCIAHVLASANFAHKSHDPEGIHQLRVAIRRMRAAFSIFRGAMPENYRLRIGDELRTLQRKLGAAREWDVMVEETIASMPRRLRASWVDDQFGFDAPPIRERKWKPDVLAGPARRTLLRK
jgi:CHAD domain-containing protein